MKSVLFSLVAVLILSQAADAAPKLSAADKAWIGTCVNTHVTESKAKPKASRVYCVCMHEMVDSKEGMTQTDLVRSWPPIHRFCSKKAGWSNMPPL